jgi:DNA-directed RNA polymerase sigma subunit (sigma70/sigma32)
MLVDKPNPKKIGLRNPIRDMAIIIEKDKGLTLREIGENFVLSKERIRQITYPYRKKKLFKFIKKEFCMSHLCESFGLTPDEFMRIFNV